MYFAVTKLKAESLFTVNKLKGDAALALFLRLNNSLQ